MSSCWVPWCHMQDNGMIKGGKTSDLLSQKKEWEPVWHLLLKPILQLPHLLEVKKHVPMVVHRTPYMSITWLSCLRKSVVEVCISLLSKSKAWHVFVFLDCRRNLRHQSVFWWQWEDLEWRRLHRSHGLWRNRDPEVDQELYKWTRARTRLTELKCFDFLKVSHSFLSSIYVSLFWKFVFFLLIINRSHMPSTFQFHYSWGTWRYQPHRHGCPGLRFCG
jgi:hypothetical protein